jgi:hypothetical protein
LPASAALTSAPAGVSPATSVVSSATASGGLADAFGFGFALAFGFGFARTFGFALAFCFAGFALAFFAFPFAFDFAAGRALDLAFPFLVDSAIAALPRFLSEVLNRFACPKTGIRSAWTRVPRPGATASTERG